ncbi:Peroxiredoxin-6 [Pteropus alecto]|uniref:Peroxiredoxin-6 n=1 Tax=Pteropus alecto TaxID=9402 RepID=L5JQT0_PTEAL|nr:Peroxiredoxin-6 [Pteropus alecto]
MKVLGATVLVLLCTMALCSYDESTKETFGCLLSQSRANKEPREVGRVQKKSGEEVTAGGKLYEEIPMIYSEKLGLLRGFLLGYEAPNVKANMTISRIHFHGCLGDSQGILFSHSQDFTSVCTTEPGRAAKLAPEFAKRNVKLIALSIDSTEDHLAYSKDIDAYYAEKDKKGMPVSAPVVFIFGPDKKLKLSILYPVTSGRNLDEILRVVISFQLTVEKMVATPAD